MVKVTITALLKLVLTQSSDVRPSTGDISLLECRRSSFTRIRTTFARATEEPLTTTSTTEPRGKKYTVLCDFCFPVPPDIAVLESVSAGTAEV